jgi:ribosomal protein L12E/L44/L45/RPP1/RPP2
MLLLSCCVLLVCFSQKIYFFSKCAIVLLKSCWAGLIDKRVISSVIGLFASVRTCSVAVRVIELTFNLLCKRTGVWISESQPCVAEDDDRFAAAINAGMTEACLAMLKRFAGQRKYTELILNIDNLLDSVNRVKGKKRSARAMKSNRKSIEQALKTSEEVLTGAKEKAILNLVSKILFIADYCRQCEKILEKEDILCCSRCKVAKYCGKDCQVKHWRSHKVFCHAAVMNAKQIKSNGGSDADILLQNASDYFKQRGLDVANKNSATIAFMAISKGYNILDCVADIDLAVSSPSIEVMLAADFLAQVPVGSSKAGVTKEMVKDAQKLKKGIIEEAQQKKFLPVNIVGYEFGVQLGMVQLLPVPMSFARPGYCSIFGRTWPELEKSLRNMFCGEEEKMNTIKHMVDTIPGFLDRVEKVIAYGTFKMKEEGNESDESEEEITSLIKEMLNESDESQEEIISLIEEMANINLDELREENVTEKVSSAPAPAAAASDVTVKENKDEEITVDDDEKEEAKSSPIASGRNVAETPAAKVDDSNEVGSKPATLSNNGDSKPAAAPVAYPVANVSKPPPPQPQPTLPAAAAANPFKLKVEDAKLYLDQVKLEFRDRPHIYNQFLEILKSFQAREVDTIGVINSVCKLFHGHNNLILGFSMFLPEGYKIEMRDLECSYE